MNVLAQLQASLTDRYVIEREIGAGGMATVYLAEDLKHGRRVAIKVLSPSMTSAMSTERFLREIRLVASLQHPHVLPLHDSGEADGMLYYCLLHRRWLRLRPRRSSCCRSTTPARIRMTPTSPPG